MNVRDLIERYNAAWNAQDLDGIHELHHPEIVFDNPPAKKWDGVDVFPLRDGPILRKDVYSSSHRPCER